MLHSVLRHVGIDVRYPTAGRISKELDQQESVMGTEREIIRIVVRISNKIAREYLSIGLSWGGPPNRRGEWVPVISLGADEYDLLDVLMIQREATRAAVRIPAHLQDWDGQVGAWENS